ncbi:hypothetical protein [Shewanella chilikensis]|uniref:hypothetical protein n=1 Tax=Shewanella chilikensis TaxID=558541 RepID=UPI001F420194|nr:hypothetical protein [Shewanella chilikensis]MCE9789887.1 hypothetical protein [Shewanella chilikensis]
MNANRKKIKLLFYNGWLDSRVILTLSIGIDKKIVQAKGKPFYREQGEGDARIKGIFVVFSVGIAGGLQLGCLGGHCWITLVAFHVSIQGLVGSDLYGGGDYFNATSPDRRMLGRLVEGERGIDSANGNPKWLLEDQLFYCHWYIAVVCVIALVFCIRQG